MGYTSLIYFVWADHFCKSNEDFIICYLFIILKGLHVVIMLVIELILNACLSACLIWKDFSQSLSRYCEQHNNDISKIIFI